MRAIYKRELKSYFCSMTGYVFIAFMTMFMGIYFMVYNMINGYPYFSYTLNSILMILMIAVPILTMRSMSDEHRARTDQLLLTSPYPYGVLSWESFFPWSLFSPSPWPLPAFAPSSSEAPGPPI